MTSWAPNVRKTEGNQWVTDGPKEMLEKCSRNDEEMQGISEGLKGARGNAKEMLEESQLISNIARELKGSHSVASELQGSQRVSKGLKG